MLCPSDMGRGNQFVDQRGTWARGNYGYNAIQFWPNEYVWKYRWSRRSGLVDKYRPFYNFNIGMGGFDDTVNKMVLSIAKMTDGTTKTIALAELRVGLSEKDRRGVWAMGMCGSNIHCRHAGFSINSCSRVRRRHQGRRIDHCRNRRRAHFKAECMMPATWPRYQRSIRCPQPASGRRERAPWRTPACISLPISSIAATLWSMA